MESCRRVADRFYLSQVLLTGASLSRVLPTVFFLQKGFVAGVSLLTACFSLSQVLLTMTHDPGEYIYIYIYVHVHLYIYTSIYIYIYIYTDVQNLSQVSLTTTPDPGEYIASLSVRVLHLFYAQA